MEDIVGAHRARQASTRPWRANHAREPERATAGQACPASLDPILRSRILSRAERRALLLQRASDELALLAADGEGMPGARPTRLDRVQCALDALPSGGRV